MKPTDSGSNRPGVLWLVGASSEIGYCLAGGGLPRAGQWPPDAIAVTHDQHADQYLGVHRGTSGTTVIGGDLSRNNLFLFDEIINDRLLVAIKLAGQGNYEEMEGLYDMGHCANKLSVTLSDNNIIRFVRIFSSCEVPGPGFLKILFSDSELIRSQSTGATKVKRQKQ